MLAGGSRHGAPLRRGPALPICPPCPSPRPPMAGWSLFLQHTRHAGWGGMGHPALSQTQLSCTTVPTKPSWTPLPQSRLSQQRMDVDAMNLSRGVGARAGVSLHTLSTTPGLSLSSSVHLLHRRLGRIPREGAHTHSLDLGQGLGTGLSPASCPEPAGQGSALKCRLHSPHPGETPLTSKQAGRAHTRRDRAGSEEDGRLRCAAEGRDQTLLDL